jgi:hypothetical protein
LSDAVVRGRPEAAAPFAIPADPAAKLAARASKLRREGVIRAVIAGLFAAGLFVFGRVVVGSIAASLGTLTLVLALASPTGGYAALSKLVDRFSSIVGTVLAWILLAPVFFLFFVPFRLLFRRGAGDTLARGFDRTRKSYWAPHDKVADLEKPY